MSSEQQLLACGFFIIISKVLLGCTWTAACWAIDRSRPAAAATL